MTTITKLKDHFDKALARPVELESYEGNEWWQLSSAQAEVFGLEVDDVPALVLAWTLYESIADVAAHEFGVSPLCAEVRAALSHIQQGVIDPAQWLPFAALFGIREKKAFAWFYKTTFEIELSWAAAPRPDDDLPMPRARLLPKPTHPPIYDGRSALDDGIPF